MKSPFKLSKRNIIYASILAVIIIILNIRILGFDAFSIGIVIGSIIGIMFISILIALLFWLISGRKEKGGTTAFNVVLSIMFISSVSESVEISKARQQPVNNLQKAISDYKQRSLADPDSTDSNYTDLTTTVKNSIDDLINNSVGEERKVWLAFKQYFRKSDSTNLEWNNAFNSFNQPRILDFTLLNNPEEFEFQKQIIQEYINESINLKAFVSKRMDILNEETKKIDKTDETYEVLMASVTKKDSIQKPIFRRYINAHIAYGQEIKDIIELLQYEEGRWRYEIETETLIFDNLDAQNNYDRMLYEAVINEEIVNELSDRLIEEM